MAESNETYAKQTMAGGGWTDAEIATYLRRMERLMLLGMSEVEAAALAQTLLHRDRPGSGDDRRLCLECRHLQDKDCKASVSGLAKRRRRALQPVRTVLQRCDGFVLKGAAK